MECRIQNSFISVTLFPLRYFRSYEGWDNPFRPDGEISHEAEELLRQWKRGVGGGGGGGDGGGGEAALRDGRRPQGDEADGGGSKAAAAPTSIMKNGSSSSKARAH